MRNLKLLLVFPQIYINYSRVYGRLKYYIFANILFRRKMSIENTCNILLQY